jgi:DNA-binding NarL/FixJ family response regulator
MTPAHPRTVLVADHAGELSATVAQSSSVVTVGDLATVLRLARSDRPAAVVVHGDFPPEGGISTLTRLAPLALPTVLVLTRTGETALAAALRSGTRSVIAIGAPADRMRRAIEAALRGDLFLAPEFARDLPALVSDEIGDRYPFPQLTARERDILAQLASGADAGHIAARLGVSRKTVRNQLARVQSKLDVSDRAQAARLARGAGLGRLRPAGGAC